MLINWRRAVFSQHPLTRRRRVGDDRLGQLGCIFKFYVKPNCLSPKGYTLIVLQLDHNAWNDSECIIASPHAHCEPGSRPDVDIRLRLRLCRD